MPGNSLIEDLNRKIISNKKVLEATNLRITELEHRIKNIRKLEDTYGKISKVDSLELVIINPKTIKGATISAGADYDEQGRIYKSINVYLPPAKTNLDENLFLFKELKIYSNKGSIRVTGDYKCLLHDKIKKKTISLIQNEFNLALKNNHTINLQVNNKKMSDILRPHFKFLAFQ